MLQKPMKYLVVISFVVFLSAFSVDDRDPSLNLGKELQAERFIAELESAEFDVSTGSLGGTWVAVSYVEYLKEKVNADERYKGVTSEGISIELVKVKISEDYGKVAFIGCGEDEAPLEYELDQNSDSFDLKDYAFSYARGSTLSKTARAVIHSNTKITVSEYVINYGEELEKGFTTLVKISDAFNADLGTVTVNNITESVACFDYSFHRTDFDERDAKKSFLKALSAKVFNYNSLNGKGKIEKRVKTYVSGVSEDDLDIRISSKRGDINFMGVSNTASVNFTEEGVMEYTGDVMILSEENQDSISLDISL